MIETLHRIGSRVRHSPALERQTWFWRRLEPVWQRAFAGLTSRGGFPAAVNGEVFLLLYEHGSRYDRIGSYEPVFHGDFTARVRRGMTVLDIGAHIGFFALAAANRVGPAGKVVAFEPSAETAEILDRHVRLNGHADRIEAVRTVVSDTDGVVTFFTSGASMAASVSRSNVEVLNPEQLAGPATETEVRSVTLDRFCQERALRPDLIKIDVEGAEVAVLRGAGALLRDVKPVVLCEVHPAQLRGCGHSMEELRAVLDSVDYRLVELDDPNEQGIFHAVLTPGG